MSRKLAITLVAALMASTVAPTLYAQTKVAVVDLQRALNETKDGQKAKRKLKRLFKKRQQELDGAQNKLKKMKDEIERQKNVLGREALAKKLESYQKAFVDLQTTYVEYQRELAKKEGQLTSKILERMQGILRTIGQQENYTVIIEANEGGVVWAPSSIDLTQRVIDKYNSGAGKKAKKSKKKGK